VAALAGGLEARGGLVPGELQVGPRDEYLRLAVLQLQRTQLPALRGAAPLRAEPLGRLGDLTTALGEGVQHAPWDSLDLEIPAALPGAAFDAIAALGELVRERRAVVRAELPRGAEDRPRGDRDQPTVLADRARDYDVAVDLRVRRTALENPACGRVPVLRRNEINCVLLDQLPVVTAAHRRHRLRQVRHRLCDGCGVRGLDLPALMLVPERPHDRHRLGRAECQVDAAAALAVGARASEPLAAAWVASLHQRDELPALDGRALDLQPGERVGCREPSAGGLRGLSLWAEVVVAAVMLDRLGLQVPGVPASFAGGDAGCGHHMGY
jgi:hypothetical protein